MDGTDRNVHGQLVALTRHSSFSSALGSVQYALLRRLPLEVRYNIYEQQLNLPVRKTETGKYMSGTFTVHRPRMPGYYRPFVEGTLKQTKPNYREMMNLRFCDIFSEKESRSPLLVPSLHPPLMTLDVDDEFGKEAFTFFWRTKLLLELATPESNGIIGGAWLKDVPESQVAEIKALHVVFRSTAERSKIPDDFSYYHGYHNVVEFGTSHTALLPTIRLEITKGGEEILIKAHCRLMWTCEGTFLSLIEKWAEQHRQKRPPTRFIQSTFNGRDLIDIVLWLQAAEKELPQEMTKYTERFYQYPYDSGRARPFQNPIWHFDAPYGEIHLTDRNGQGDDRKPRWHSFENGLDFDGSSRKGDLLVPSKVLGIVLARITA